MKDKSRCLEFLKIVSLLFVSVYLIACASVPESKHEEGLAIETIDSSTVEITRAYMKKEKEEWVLKGELTKRLGNRGPILGHLHVELLSADQQVIKHADVPYKRKSVKSRFGVFHLHMPFDLPKGGAIRITHHDAKSHEAEVEEAVWQDADE